MTLQAKIIEPDIEARRSLTKSFRYYNVPHTICGEQVQINFEGEQHQAYIFAELMRICETSRCTSFIMKG